MIRAASAGSREQRARRSASSRVPAVARRLERILVAGLAGSLIAASLAAATADSASQPVQQVRRPDPPPNILLLVAEDLGPRIGAFGDPIARTPNLDRLAAEGVRFPNTFTAAGVCAPSRAALMLGMHPISTGSQHMRTSSRPEGSYVAVPPPSAKALPELLRRGGYFTFNHGKNDYQFSDGALSGSGPFTLWDREDNDAVWNDREPGQPFFGMTNYMITHESGVFRPLGSWPHSLTHFVMQLVQYFMQSDVARAFEPTPVDPAVLPLPPYYPDVPEIRADLARFYANIETMDAEVGALLARLERDGLADSTIVIWTTDHGDGLPRAKRELFDSGIRVPMIIRWPDRLRPAALSPGDVDERLVSFVDLAPTILDFAGLPIPATLHGLSIADPAAAQREYVFASRDRIDEVDDRQRAVRDRRWKYILSHRPKLPGGHRTAFRENQDGMLALLREHEAGRLDAIQQLWFEPPGRERLYDLESDPFETRDLSQLPSHTAQLERMRSAYAAFRERVPDWSDQSEAEMVERFQPDGVRGVTAPPEIEVSRGRVSLRSASEGASIGYRVDAGRWRLYTAPFAAEPGALIEARAVRYGWLESELTRRTLPGG